MVSVPVPAVVSGRAASEEAFGEQHPDGVSWALRAAALCVVGLALTWVVAELVPGGRAHDAAALLGFSDLWRPRIDTAANAVARSVSARPYALLAIILLVVAVIRRRPRTALAVAVVLLGAGLSAEALKPLLAHPHAYAGNKLVEAGSWPSGHSTAAMSLALCAVMVAPARMRVVVAVVGSLLAVAVSFALLVLAWHLPSDVVGGYLLAGLWASLAVAGLRSAQTRWPAPELRPAASGETQSSEARPPARPPLSRAPATRRTRAGWPSRSVRRATGPRPSLAVALGREAMVPAALLCAMAAILAVAVILRPEQVTTFAVDHRSLVAAGAVIVVLAGSLASGLAAVMRR